MPNAHISKVQLYGTRFCGYCRAARRLLVNKGVDFQDIAVDGNPELRAEVMQRSGRRTVPQIWIGKTHVGGFDDLLQLEQNKKLDDLLSAT